MVRDENLKFMSNRDVYNSDYFNFTLSLASVNAVCDSTFCVVDLIRIPVITLNDDIFYYYINTNLRVKKLFHSLIFKGLKVKLIFHLFLILIHKCLLCDFQICVYLFVAIVTDEAEASRLPTYGQRESSAGCSLSLSHLPAHQKETPVLSHIFTCW